ncbi:MAG: RnfABCDGE type electron transport complex subunit D [Desulfatibacillaceae bacterium]
MKNKRMFVVSHASFWHNGDRISTRNYNILLATLPAVIFGLVKFGGIALGVLGLSVSLSMAWEWIMCKAMGRENTLGDMDAAVLGVLFAMVMPATMPWWAMVVGTFVMVVIGKMIFGGIGGAPFNPVILATAIVGVSWAALLNFDARYLHYVFDHNPAYPLASAKAFGAEAAANWSTMDLLMGNQIGGMGAVFGLGLLIGGIYLILRGHIRWEISVSFLAAVAVTAFLFQVSDPDKYAGPLFHLFTGYTLIGAFFLATHNSSSPVNFVPMLLFGAGIGVMTMLIRNIGAYQDGVVYAILLFNVANPLLDRIRPKALGKVVQNA